MSTGRVREDAVYRRQRIEAEIKAEAEAERDFKANYLRFSRLEDELVAERLAAER